MIQNAKAKGNKFEKEIAYRIREIDTTASRNYGSGSGQAKSDVHNALGYELECKHVERINIWNAIQEAERHAEQAHSIPTVIFKRNRTPEPYVAIPLWHFIELVKRSREPKVNNPDRELMYLFEQHKNISHKIAKKLNQ